MIEVDPTSPNRIYVGTYGYYGGFFKSENYGTGWQFIMSDEVVGVQINPAANNEVYIAVNNEAIVEPEPRNGIWATTDGGSTWQQMSSGLTMSSVGYLNADWRSRILYAGTWGGGIFRTFLPGTPARPTISGTVTTLPGLGLPDVLLNFSNGGGTVMTVRTAITRCRCPGLVGDGHAVQSRLFFTPADRTYANVTANIGGEDYGEYLHAVSVPVSPNGLSRGEKSVSYAFASGGSACSQGHGVEYRFDWGDGSASGWSTAASASHSWSTPGACTVTVQARCSVNTVLVSGWSEGTNITILDQYTEPDKHAVGDFDGDGLDEAAVDFGTQGVWQWNGGIWDQLSSANAEHLVAGNLDGDGDDEIVGDFGSDGIWAWDGGGWVQLSSQNSELMIMAKIDGDAAEELIVDLGSLGLWMWNGAAGTSSRASTRNIS